MALNWKIRLTKNQTDYLGSSDGSILNDLNKVISSLNTTKENVFDLIQNIRIVKVDLQGAGAIDSVKFTYLIETKDKNIEVEGYRHGEPSGSGTTWSFKDDWYFLSARGWYGKKDNTTLIRKLDLWSWKFTGNSFWMDGKGSKQDGDNAFELFAPACFFSKSVVNPWNANSKILGAIGCYWGELYDSQSEKDKESFANWTKKYEELAIYYKDNLRADLNDTPFHPDGLKEVKKTLDQLKADKAQLETDKTNLNNTITSKDTTISELNTKLANKENELISANNSITTLTNEKNGLETKLNEKDGEITKLNQQITQQGNQDIQANQYLSKLLEVYKTQITQATEAFYLNDLGLDETDDINPKYWKDSPQVSYLKRLDNTAKFNGNSNPEQIISAFKIVALISATEKAQKISDKWINSPVSKNKQFRENKLKYFNNIKKFWDLNKGTIKPTVEENNPLFVMIIDSQNTYRNQLENIIELWQ